MSYLPELRPITPPPQRMEGHADWADFVKRYLSDNGTFREVLRAWINDANDCCDDNTAAIAGHETRIDALEAAIPSLPVSIANGGTGQTTATAAFDALAPTTTKGDLIVSNGTDNIRVAVGTNGYPLIAASAAASGVAWATTQEDLTWWFMFDARPIVGSAAASPPTLAVADTSLTDTTDGDGHSAGRDATDANFTWAHFAFLVPDELDKTVAVNAKVYFRLANNAAAGEKVQFTTRLRAVNRDELIVSAGSLREVAGTLVLTGYAAGDLGICSITASIAANDMADDDYVKGVVERDATAGNANDTYPATVRLIGIKFVGKRKVRT